MRALDTPVKRAGALVALAGAGLLLLGLVRLEYQLAERVALCMLDEGRRSWDGCGAARWGGWAVIVGLATSLGFDYTIGPLWRWIRYGRAPRKVQAPKPMPLEQERELLRRPVTPEEMARARQARDDQEDARARHALERAKQI